MENVPVGTNYYCPALLHSIFFHGLRYQKNLLYVFPGVMKRTSDVFVFATYAPEKKKKYQSKSAMFTLGDGRDGCSLLQGAFSIRFRDKADWWMSSSSYLSLAEGMGYLNAVNN